MLLQVASGFAQRSTSTYHPFDPSSAYHPFDPFDLHLRAATSPQSGFFPRKMLLLRRWRNTSWRAGTACSR
jgi:hypothetical protein